MKWLFTPRVYHLFGDVALLITRLYCGAAFMMHGWPKIQNPTGWMGENAFAPAPLVALAAIAEFGGGIAWVLGLLTPVFSFLILCTMGVAVYMHTVMLGDPLFATRQGGSAEPAAVLFCVALMLLALGPGRLSADQLIFGRRTTKTVKVKD